MKRSDPYSYPPRGLSREAAARYIGVSTTKFDELVRDGRMPKPVRIDGRVIWDRIKVDMSFSDLGEDESANSGENEWDVLLDPNDVTTAPQNTRSKKGPSGYPVPIGADHPLRQYYDRLGFDPETMGQADMDRLRAEAHERWKAEFVHTPLGKRERDTLRQFEPVEPGHLVTFNSIKGLGINTAECLEARGFIEIRYRANDPNRLEGWVLTAEGKEASRAILADQEPQRPAN